MTREDKAEAAGHAFSTTRAFMAHKEMGDQVSCSLEDLEEFHLNALVYLLEGIARGKL